MYSKLILANFSYKYQISLFKKKYKQIIMTFIYHIFNIK